jgi:hypothetical protein
MEPLFIRVIYIGAFPFIFGKKDILKELNLKKRQSFQKFVKAKNYTKKYVTR